MTITPKRRWTLKIRALVVVLTLLCLFLALAIHNLYAAMAVVMWLTIPAIIVGVLAAGQFLVRLCFRRKALDDKPESELHMPKDQNGKHKLPKGEFSLGDWFWTIIDGLFSSFP